MHNITKLRKWLILSLIFYGTMSQGCQHDGKGSPSIVKDAQNPLEFVNSSFLPAGTWGNPMMTWDPAIIREGTKIHLFFATIFCTRNNDWYFSWNPADPTACEIGPGKLFFSIGYAFKDEAVSNEFTFRSTPLLAPATPGAWDDDYIETPSVIRSGSKVHIFYSAMPKNKLTPGTKSARYQIGVATLDLVDFTAPTLEKLLLSDLKLRFQRNSNNPIVPRSKVATRFDRENTQEPTVIHRDGHFELFYLGLRANKKGTALPLDDNEPLLDSTADIKEMGLGRVCLDNNLQKQTCHLDGEAILTSLGSNPIVVNMPEVSWFQNLYYLFYAAGPDGDNHKGQKIFYRTTPDLISWTPEALLIGGNTTAEDNWGVHSPAATVSDSPQGPVFEMAYQAWGAASRGTNNAFCLKDRFRVPASTDPATCNSTAIGFARQRPPK